MRSALLLLQHDAAATGRSARTAAPDVAPSPPPGGCHHLPTTSRTQSMSRRHRRRPASAKASGSQPVVTVGMEAPSAFTTHFRHLRGARGSGAAGLLAAGRRMLGSNEHIIMQTRSDGATRLLRPLLSSVRVSIRSETGPHRAPGCRPNVVIASASVCDLVRDAEDQRRLAASIQRP